MEEYRVGTLPTLYYIPDFISDLQQSQILHHIYEAPVTKWKSLKNRRLQNWGGVVHEKGLLPQDLPPWLKGVTNKICDMTGLFPSPINHVLINEYLPDQGIMPHQDGPAYFPVVAILSLGSSAVMDFTPHVRLREFSLLLKPCSLLIFKDKAYSDYLHGIEDSHIHKPDKSSNLALFLCSFSIQVNIKEAQLHPSTGATKTHQSEEAVEQISIQRSGTRISLTCRLVLKVHKNLFKF
ncbi:hypothetical protein QJS04_geneDACA015141 [Acorus gramineus]|uniref:Fe2OG dioxygenase domain-containing protein n=1 Tax=Acorus gramineus TaxID=55184 RepID=A0AAV9BX44_ACOGR|nr:hypothetical protein QJS04_geneDACA015141 [Acorus gramineus]